MASFPEVALHVIFWGNSYVLYDIRRDLKKVVITIIIL